MAQEGLVASGTALSCGKMRCGLPGVALGPGAGKATNNQVHQSGFSN